MNCPVCETIAGNYRRQVNGSYSIIKCANCGLEYTDPIPKEEELNLFYSTYEDVRAERRIVELNAMEHLKTLAKYGWSEQSKVLDFGAGKGIFVEVAGKYCFGVDFQHSEKPRIKTCLDEDFEGIKSWDFITLWGVLEHLSKPKQVMRELASRLRGGGVIALTTVDAEGIIPYYYKPPEHLSYWTKPAFCFLSQECGLEIMEYQPYHMFQLGHIYVKRLLSRTPEKYRKDFVTCLPEIIQVPTNEVRVVMKKVSNRLV